MSVDKTEGTCQKTIESQDINMSKICHGNLGVLGKFWILTLRSALVGSTLCPVAVCAAKVNPCPAEKRPNKLRLSELSIYECPALLEEPQCDPKMMFKTLLPYVSAVRQNCQEVIIAVRKEINDTVDEVTRDFFRVRNRITKYFRAEENLDTRLRLVYTGGLIGFLKSGYLTTRLISSACVMTVTGLLCFPKETDRIIRNVSYHTGQAAASVIYFMDGKTPPSD